VPQIHRFWLQNGHVVLDQQSFDCRAVARKKCHNDSASFGYQRAVNENTVACDNTGTIH